MKASSTTSLLVRSILAVVLLVGFYALALSIALGLLYIPYAEIVYVHRIHFKIAIFCIVGAGLIIKGMIPRVERFEAPGPRLLSHAHPLLFQELGTIASRMKQKMPDDVYLLNEANAWVAQHGGFLGIGSRRMMGLGLPLLSSLKVSEFRGVIAHEFGHYFGGDTKLGPWIYGTRNAIARTIHSLSEHSTLLQRPFYWYGNTFLRVTHAISRHQEFTADSIAARIAGQESLISGLKVTYETALAYSLFWRQEYVPVLSSGYVAPLGAGFNQFLSAKSIHEEVSRAVNDEIASAKSNPYDTHPPLRERIIAIKAGPGTKVAIDDRPAISLLNEVSRLEKELLAFMAGKDSVAKLKSLSWDDAGDKVYLPSWLEYMKRPEVRRVLRDLKPESLAQMLSKPSALAARLSDTMAEDERKQIVEQSIGVSLAVALHQKGFRVTAEPGAPIACIRAEVIIEPFLVAERLRSESIFRESWLQLCRDSGIMGVELSTLSQFVKDASLHITN